MNAFINLLKIENNFPFARSYFILPVLLFFPAIFVP